MALQAVSQCLEIRPVPCCGSAWRYHQTPGSHPHLPASPSCTIGRAITFGGPKTLVVSGLMQFTWHNGGESPGTNETCCWVDLQFFPQDLVLRVFCHFFFFSSQMHVFPCFHLLPFTSSSDIIPPPSRDHWWPRLEGSCSPHPQRLHQPLESQLQ